MTVIFSNTGDEDCRVLRSVFQGLDGAKVVEILPKTWFAERKILRAIRNEDDTLLLLGHGSNCGLLHPNIRQYLVDEAVARHIHARNVICIWCYASSFCVSSHLKSFSTSMFISNTQEAKQYGMPSCTQDHINAIGTRFYKQVNTLLKSGEPLSSWPAEIIRDMDHDDPIDVFNRQGCIYHNQSATN